jgi:hypothetical protein
MKRIIALAFAATWLVACNDTSSSENATTDEKSEAPISSPAPSTTYSPADGDVTYREDKVRVYRNGEWADADNDVTLDNGAVVYRDGRVKRDDKEVELEDGEVVNKSGDFFDKTGNAVEKGWKDIKQGAKAMGKDIEKGAKKVGEKVEGTVDGDHHNDDSK